MPESELEKALAIADAPVPYTVKSYALKTLAAEVRGLREENAKLVADRDMHAKHAAGAARELAAARAEVETLKAERALLIDQSSHPHALKLYEERWERTERERVHIARQLGRIRDVLDGR